MKLKAMKVKHAEYSIFISAPWDKGPCQYGVDLVYPVNCQNDGSFAVKFLDDRDQVIHQYPNICEAHLVLVVLDQLMGH